MWLFSILIVAGAIVGGAVGSFSALAWWMHITSKPKRRRHRKQADK
jgi:hypothetical protein